MFSRQKAASAITTMGKRSPELRVVSGLKKTKTVGEFYDLLSDVKFFVSPYGYGEFANKDYEAVLSGCVLVSLAPSTATAAWVCHPIPSQNCAKSRTALLTFMTAETPSLSQPHTLLPP